MAGDCVHLAGGVLSGLAPHFRVSAVSVGILGIRLWGSSLDFSDMWLCHVGNPIRLSRL